MGDKFYDESQKHGVKWATDDTGALATEQDAKGTKYLMEFLMLNLPDADYEDRVATLTACFGSGLFPSRVTNIGAVEGALIYTFDYTQDEAIRWPVLCRCGVEYTHAEGSDLCIECAYEESLNEPDLTPNGSRWSAMPVACWNGTCYDLEYTDRTTCSLCGSGK